MVKGRLPGIALALIAVFAAREAVAGCREDPREAKLGQQTVHLKTYNCYTGSAAGGVKVEFYRFSYDAASTIVTGRQTASMTQIIGRPNLVKNGVFEKFKYIVDNFGATWSLDLGNPENGGTVKINDKSFDIIDKGKVSKFKLNDDVEYNPTLEISDLNKRIVPANLNVYYASCNGSSECASDGDRKPIFWRYVKLEEVVKYHENAVLRNEAARLDKGVGNSSQRNVSAIRDKAFDFLLYLSGSAGLPYNFLLMSGAYSAECGEPGFSWNFGVGAPSMTLEAAVIRNDTARPLRIDSVLGEEIAEGPLRVADGEAPVDFQPSNLGAFIEPSHSLLIPTRILLTTTKSSFQANITTDLPAEAYRRLRAKGFTTRADAFAAPKLNDYVFGPELKVAGLTVDGDAIPFAKKSENFLDVAYSPQVGSCPYLLSWNDQRRDWIEHGKVLHEASDSRREATQRIALPGFVSRFRLEEREPEVATIDDVELTLGLKGGDLIVLEPDASNLADAELKFLFWGEAREFQFSLPAGVSASDVVESQLALTGFYERYSSLPSSSNRGGGAIAPKVSFSAAASAHRGGPEARLYLARQPGRSTSEATAVAPGIGD